MKFEIIVLSLIDLIFRGLPPPLLFLTTFFLRWYGAPPCCDVLHIKINNKSNKISLMFSFLKLLLNSVAQRVRALITDLYVMSSNSPWSLIIFDFPKNLEMYFWSVIVKY